MKKTLFLHIGMGKTGTTALQHFFWHNRQQLLGHGISYPEYGTMTHAHHLLSPLSPRIPPFLRDNWDFKPVADWVPQLQTLKADRILISSELMAWTEREDVEKFCREVGRSFDLKVVLYLRRQDNMIMASYSQLVKSGSQQFDIRRALEKLFGEFDYGRVIEPWASALGKGNIIIRPYEKQQFHAGDIRRDFMHHVFDIDVDADFELPEGDPNPRFSQAALAYKLHLNRLLQNPERAQVFNDVLVRYTSGSGVSLQQPDRPAELLSPRERVDILRRTEALNQKIAREYLHRDDGILFREPIPQETGSWARPDLTIEEARTITRFIELNDAEAYSLLVAVVNAGNRALLPVEKDTRRFFRRCIPAPPLSERLGHFLRIGNSRSPRELTLYENPMLLISVHFPLVSVNAYDALIQRHFGRDLIRDYQDRPLARSGPGRKLDAVGNGLRFARLGVLVMRDTCMHGHFMPLKYRLPGRGYQKSFVTWMCDPVDRLVSHYQYWKGSTGLGLEGGLQYRMLEEDWSLETFCLCPEMRNVYSQFLWGFPLARFDFVGIAERLDSELQRFSEQVLGRPLADGAVDIESAQRRAMPDADLRARIEAYHGADMALYRQALKKREEQLSQVS